MKNLLIIARIGISILIGFVLIMFIGFSMISHPITSIFFWILSTIIISYLEITDKKPTPEQKWLKGFKK